MLREYSGTAFDPALVELFVARLNMNAVSPVIANSDETDSAWIEREGLIALQDIAGAHREEQTLYEIAQALGSSLGVTDAMALIQEKVNRLVPFVTCALFLGNDEEGYECRYAHGPGTEALFKWRPKSWSDVALRLPSCADGREAHGNELTSLLPCRLTFDGRLIGGLVIYHTAAGCFTDEHRRVLGRVSDQAAAVIFNSTRFEQTQHESHTDPLTGLSNRRSLDRQFETGLAHAIRTHGSISVVVLDMDRLKEINDTYGHEAGDRALRAIGSVLKAHRAAERSLRAIRGRRVRRRAVGLQPRERSRGACRSCRRRSPLIHSNLVRASGCRCRSAPDRRASRWTARASKSCWRRPTRACTATRPAGGRETPAVRPPRATKAPEPGPLPPNGRGSGSR